MAQSLNGGQKADELSIPLEQGKRQNPFAVDEIGKQESKRHFSIQSIESLMRKAQTVLLRSSTAISFRAPQANATEQTRPARTQSTNSSLRHKRDVSDLRVRYLGGGRPTTEAKRSSRVVSEDGDSMWITDDEGEDGWSFGE